jgi:hypothetical protein
VQERLENDPAQEVLLSLLANGEPLVIQGALQQHQNALGREVVRPAARDKPRYCAPDQLTFSC